MDGISAVLNKKKVDNKLAGFKWTHPKKTAGYFWARTRVSEPCAQPHRAIQHSMPENRHRF